MQLTLLTQLVLFNLLQTNAALRLTLPATAETACKGAALTRRPSSAGAASHAADSVDTACAIGSGAVQRRASESTLGHHITTLHAACLEFCLIA